MLVEEEADHKHPDYIERCGGEKWAVLHRAESTAEIEQSYLEGAELTEVREGQCDQQVVPEKEGSPVAVYVIRKGQRVPVSPVWK
ncbi:hypothetical protein [Arthrobacter sp. Ld5]|uniref:hypothetical protein n=1 Tax=Arthrobacter sp. Ld5 TaxID=649152 RepID=UPI003EC0B93F